VSELIQTIPNDYLYWMKKKYKKIEKKVLFKKEALKWIRKIKK